MAHEKRIGLALGGGGARGIAHILVCEAFDELGLKPAIIAGTSIGAVVGAGYAAGMTGREMRERCCAFYARRRAVYSALWRVRPRALADLVRGRIASAQFDAELILQTFVPGWELLPETFEDLTIPLKVVACDFYGWTETVMETGTLRPAVAASIAIPSIFRPVAIHGRMQIDGGAVNPLPFDLVSDADLVVASDVAGGPSGDPARCPGMLETVIGAAQISMQAVIAAKLKLRHPDILVQPEINGVFVLDFLKSEAILANNVTLKDEVKRRLERAVEAPNDDEEGGPPSPNGTAHHFVMSTGAMA